MYSTRFTLLIHSCDKFSDLWEAHVTLLNRNWPTRPCRTIILTDSPTDRRLPGVEILCAGEGKEITERIQYAIPLIHTEYVLVTLDDYFPTTYIDTRRIERLLDIMAARDYDYMRLYHRPKGGTTPTGEKNVYDLSLDGNYRVNLYAGIWRTDFMAATLGDEVLNAWNFEVALTANARVAEGKCAVSKGREFPILDVVRKGRILPKAARYLKKHDLYHGPRESMPYWAYFKLGIKTQGNRLLSVLPDSIYQATKRLCVACGMSSFSVSK